MLNNESYHETLTKSELRKLNNLLRKEYGSTTAAVKKSGLSYGTLQRVGAGMKVKKETAHTIRTVLLNQKLQTISELELTNEG